MSQWAYLANGPCAGRVYKLPEFMPVIRAYMPLDDLTVADLAYVHSPLPVAVYRYRYPLEHKLLVGDDMEAVKAGTLLDDLPRMAVDSAIVYEYAGNV